MILSTPIRRHLRRCALRRALPRAIPLDMLQCRGLSHLRFFIPASILTLLVCGSLVAQQPARSFDSPYDTILASQPTSGETEACDGASDGDYGQLTVTASASDANGEGSAPPGIVSDPQAPPKDAADAHTPPNADQDERIPQTKRILGFIPNFRAISTDEKLPAQTVKEKFVTATEDSFDYSSVGIPLLLAWYSLETNATPEFGHGAAGYGRYFWHAAVDQTTENYMVEFVVPVITREDTRYYTMGRGGFTKRVVYAASRVVLTRSDSDKQVVNLSEIVGAGGSAGISSLYYPSRERSFANTGKQWGLDLGIDAVSDVAKEFWPDINHWISRRKKASLATAP